MSDFSSLVSSRTVSSDCVLTWRVLFRMNGAGGAGAGGAGAFSFSVSFTVCTCGMLAPGNSTCPQLQVSLICLCSRCCLLVAVDELLSWRSIKFWLVAECFTSLRWCMLKPQHSMSLSSGCGINMRSCNNLGNNESESGCYDHVLMRHGRLTNTDLYMCMIEVTSIIWFHRYVFAGRFCGLLLNML